MAEPAYVKKLVEYFEKNLKKGYTPDSLKWALINQGYARTSVEQALDFANKEMAKEAPILKEKPLITHEVINDEGNPVEVKKPFWKRFLGL